MRTSTLSFGWTKPATPDTSLMRTAMSAMSASLSEADIKDLAAHYSRQSARPVTYVVIPAKK